VFADGDTTTVEYYPNGFVKRPTALMQSGFHKDGIERENGGA